MEKTGRSLRPIIRRAKDLSLAKHFSNSGETFVHGGFKPKAQHSVVTALQRIFFSTVCTALPLNGLRIGKDVQLLVKARA